MLDRPVVLSPKDWALISDWHSRRIPLTLILEAIRYAAEQPSRVGTPRNLAYVAPAVEEAWRVVLDGRRRPLEPATPSRADPADAWRRRREAETGDSPLGRLLDELLTAHEAGKPARVLDSRLDEWLLTSASEDLLRTIRDQIDAELAPFVERMDAETFDRTRRSAIVDRLRRALGLPFLDQDPEYR
jgi:hypothetical protein